MDIKHYLENTDLTLQQIADRLGITYKRVYTVWKTYPSRYRKARKSANYRKAMLGNTRGSRDTYSLVSDSKGYLLIKKPEWYTGRKKSTHIFYHHYVYCKAESLTEIPKGHVVHHCDANPHNNDLSNLMLMTMSDHAALHSHLLSATTISKESTAKWLEARKSSKEGKI